MDTTKAITHISLCAGYGGIDLGLSRAIPSLRTVAFSEIEAFACANLVAKMEAGLLDAAPIWTNLKTFPWSDFRDRVDILSGGYPCQPFSAAGKRLGTEDPRHLWPFIADGIRAMRPRVCFFENVEGHISLGLREVISELEGIGYQTTWGIFSAREVGAPHQRKRVFILAYLKCAGLERLYKWHTPSEQTESVGADFRSSGQRSAWEGCKLADTSDGTDTASGHAETHRLPSEYREAVCSGESGGANADAWPSRPGQPQYGWEPPRVVANSNSLRLEGWKGKLRESERGNNVIHASISSERYATMGNAIHGRHGQDVESGDAGTQDGRGQVRSDGTELPSGEAVGNATHGSNGQHTSEQQGWDTSGRPSAEGVSMGNTQHDGSHQRGSQTRGTESCGEQRWVQESEGGSSSMGDTAEQGREGSGGENDKRGQFLRSSESDGSCANGSMESGQWQTEPTLGGDVNGTASGMDYAELQGTDNSMRRDDAAEVAGTVADSEHKREDGTTGKVGGEECENEGEESQSWNTPQATWNEGSGGEYSQLCVTCDNRTDELRLLGNGVVPATAERAFRTLLAELIP